MSELPEPLWWTLAALVALDLVLFGLLGLGRATTWALDKWADAKEAEDEG